MKRVNAKEFLEYETLIVIIFGHNMAAGLNREEEAGGRVAVDRCQLSRNCYFY